MQNLSYYTSKVQTEKEKQFITVFYNNVKHYLTEVSQEPNDCHYSDIDINDMAELLGWSKESSKGVLSSLMNKQILDTDEVETDQVYNIIYFSEYMNR